MKKYKTPLKVEPIVSQIGSVINWKKRDKGPQH